MSKKQQIVRRAKSSVQRKVHYTTLQELMASPTQPWSKSVQENHIGRMRAALADLEHAPAPEVQSWRTLSDAINMLETLVGYGEAPVSVDGKVVASYWRGCEGLPVEIADRSGLLLDAITAMAGVGSRASTGDSMNLTPPEAEAIRATLDDYQVVLAGLPARTMIRCHRATEKRMLALFQRMGNLPEGVSVMAL